jgi:hypothetical protein
MQRFPLRNIHGHPGLGVFGTAGFAFPDGKAAEPAYFHTPVVSQGIAHRRKDDVDSRIHILLLQRKFRTYLIYEVFFQHGLSIQNTCRANTSRQEAIRYKKRLSCPGEPDKATFFCFC